MSSDQRQRPKSLISKLSSRNRRRRRESLEEKIPIPSFSFTPSHSNPDQNAAVQIDCGSNEPIPKQSSPYDKQLKEKGKENAANINSTDSSESTCAKVASKVACQRVVHPEQKIVGLAGKQSVNAASTSCPLLPDIDGQRSTNVKGTSSQNTLAHEQADDATKSATNTFVDSCMESSNLSPQRKQIEEKHSKVCDNLSSINVVDKKQSSPIIVRVASDNPECHGLSQLNNLNAGEKTDIITNCSSVTTKKRKIEAAAAVAAPTGASGDTMIVEATKALNAASNQNIPMNEILGNSESDSRRVATNRNSGTENQPLNKEQMSVSGYSSDVEIVAARLPKTDKLKSRKSVDAKTKERKKIAQSRYFKDGDSSDSDSSMDLKPAKKEAGKKRPKKPTAAIKSKMEVIDLGSDSDSSSCKPQPKKKRSAPKTTATKTEKKAKSETVTRAPANKTSKATKQIRATSKSISSDGKKLCFACSTCKCNSRDGISATPSKQSVSLSGSQARQERALINRLQKIERNIQWMESQKHDAGRQLMKQRNIMTKKFEENQLDLIDRPKFLSDIDRCGGEFNREQDDSRVGKANVFIFGEEKAKMAPKTLTQHFGRSTETNSSPTKSDSSTNEHDNNLIVESTRRSVLGQIDEEQDTDDEELQKQKVNAHLTSMADFAEAISCKGNNRYSTWDAATTASALESRLNVLLALSSPSNSSTTSPASNTGGLDELLELFAQTPSKSACLHKELEDVASALREDLDGEDDKRGVIDPEQSAEPPLTPRGRQVSCDIENSLAQEPTKLSAVERVCPKWRDNVRFAQLQTNPEKLYPALGAVRKAKSNVKRMKERILQALADREHTLELFELSLERSIERISD